MSSGGRSRTTPTEPKAVDILKQDLRYAARSLGRARGFALTAILLTALGVGANTAAFSVADFVLLRPLPFPDADALVRLCEGPREGGGWGCMNQLSPANYRDLKSMSASFEAMGAFTGATVNLVGGGEPRRLGTAQVTPDVLTVLGVKPVLGPNGYWPGQDPIGKTFKHRDQARTVVGVVGDVKIRGLERNSEPQIYLPAAQVTDDFPSILDPKDLVIRQAGQGEALVAAIRQIVRAVDPEQPISDVRTMEEVLAGDTGSRRAQLQVLGVLAVVAVLLSAVGIYGLLAYTVAQRSQEIGVRLALGADPARVGRMILAEGMRMALIGIVPGVLGAYAAARGMSALLFGVAPNDPATFATAVGLSLLMTLAGSLVPAFRAVRVSPMSALRAE